MKAFLGQMQPSHCIVPPGNPTTPSEASSLSVRNTLDGGLHASFGEPVIKPLGTRYQLIRSTNSANAAVGTTVWDGTATEVDFAAPNSAHWYYVQPYANSYFGPYSPNTYGIFGSARYPVNELLRVVGDSEFEKSSALGSYWLTGYSNIFSLSLTGGINGGRAILTLTSLDLTGATLRALFGNPIAPYPKWDNGYQLTALARMRRTAVFSWDTAISGNTYTLQLSAFCWDGVNSPNPQELGGAGNCRYFPNSNAYYSINDVNSWPLNEWRDYQVNLVLTSSGNAANYAHANSYPYLCFGFLVPGSRPRTGGLEIDLLGVQL
jgi:hypothetical protein